MKTPGFFLCQAAVACGLLAAVHSTATETNAVAERIPLSKLSAESRRLVQGVTDHATFDLQVGPSELHGNKRIFEYLLDHLELCAVAGHSLQIGKYQTRREKDGRLYGDDGEGATGYLTFVHAADGKRVFFVQGTQKDVFTVGGHSVAVLDYADIPATRDSLEYSLRVWIHVDSAFFAYLSKLFLSHSKTIAGRQFTKMLSIPVSLTQKIHEDPKAVLHAFDTQAEAEQVLLRDLKGLIQKEYP